MKFSPRVTRFFFYGLVAAGGLFLCGAVMVNTFTGLGSRLGMNPMWLGGLCCVIPFVLGGIALANESGG